MFLNRNHQSSSAAYAAWINAATDAHRSGDPAAKAQADRLHTEQKAIERRMQRTADRMRRSA